MRQRLHKRESDRQDDRRAMRFKVYGMGADWLTQGGQENDWNIVMKSAMKQRLESYQSIKRDKKRACNKAQR